jgi:hypothetical protein
MTGDELRTIDTPVGEELGHVCARKNEGRNRRRNSRINRQLKLLLIIDLLVLRWKWHLLS